MLNRTVHHSGWVTVVLTCFFLLVSVVAQAAVSPAKSPNDQSDYRYLELDNELKVLLVSNPDADMAAASLDVAVGSGDDPTDREGLSHFLEHMLFLGTEKYPDAGEYQQFIKSHGGSHNAFTAFQDTNYFFDVQADQLEPALDRFAQQFSAPLFTAELVERERRAVHSEYSSALKDDGRRIYSAKKAAANPEHAYSQFAVGNLTTLDDTDQRPLRADLLEFWRNHYSSDVMTLVVMGPQPLEELEAMVRPRFAEIENRNLAPKEHTAPLFKRENLPAILQVQALKDIRRLTLTFPIPSQQDHYKSKPDHYVANLLGHEGPGSLLDVLKRQGLVESLSAGIGMDTGSNATLEISMALTPEGLAQRDVIQALTFDYIDLVRSKGINRQYFEEMQKLAEISFRFREQPNPIQLVSRLSMQMHHVDPEDVLRAPWVMENYTPARYLELLNHLTPDNVLITVVAPEEPAPEVERTTWYDTVYSLTPIAPASVTGTVPEALANQLALPDANPFIPEELGMVAGASMEQPIQLTKGNSAGDIELWYARNTEFKTPRANVYLSLRSPGARASARSQVLTQLLVDAINTNLNAWAYPAQLAGLDYAVYNHLRGVTIRVGGYSDNLHLLMSRILSQFAAPTITEQRFNIARRQLIDELRNQSLERPVQQASTVLQSALIEGAWTVEEKLEAAEAVTLDELERFAKVLLEQVDPVMLAHGNLTEASALNLTRFAEALVLQESAPIEVPRSGVHTLPPGLTDLRMQVDHPDTGYALYLQGNSTTFAERAGYRLLAQIVSAPFYEQIRTQQQLGYVVYATSYEILETPALGFIVQSPSATAEEIDTATREFSQAFADTLQQMTEAELEREKQAVISGLLERERSLGDISERFWREIDRGETDFNSRQQLADAVREVDHADLIASYESAVIERSKALKVITTDEPGNMKAVIEQLRERPTVE
ncbi:insulinase family protein [Marinobacter changyiensis]|uniref:insulinase family protein n=1 Tax=Marinobacter changyiensis TaxID=2604091 RepID=UPI00126577A5|nr:insulinase family protein [Marinobacter changyiensis]